MDKNQDSCVIVLMAPDPLLEVRFSSRDWKLLQEDYLPGSARFLYELGFVGDTSTADGLQVGQTVQRSRTGALDAAENLWAVLEAEIELLGNDYLCEPERGQRAGGRALVSKRLGNVRAGDVEYSIEMPPGQCRLESPPTVLEEFDPRVGRVCVRPVRHPVKDLRLERVFLSENYGAIRIRKRRRGTAWGKALPILIEALRKPGTPEELRIYNAHR